MSLNRKIVAATTILVCVIASGTALLKYAPLTLADPLYPASGMVELQVKGYLQEIALGPYILWDKNCGHTTIAVISNQSQRKNKNVLNQLDLNRVPAKERNIALGTYTGHFLKSAKKINKSKNKVYFEIDDMKIEKINRINKEFSNVEKCEIVQ